jgi:hypothetical protein
MTHPAQIIIPRDYDIFGGLDVDKKSIAVTFTDTEQCENLLSCPIVRGNYLTTRGSIFRVSEWPLSTKPDRPVLVSTTS